MNPPMEPPKPILVAHLFPELLEQLLALLRQLDDADWRQPTACGGWSVHDVALHLMGVEIGNLSARRDHHTSGAFIDDWDALVDFINRWNQEWVRVARRISPPLLIELLELTGGQMSAYFQSLDPYAIGGPVSWAGPEPAPVWLDVAREYTERWHHQQHIRDAVGRPGLKEPRYLAPVLAAFARGLPRAYRTTDAPQGTSVTLTVTGPAGGQWSVRREQEEWTLHRSAPRQPDAETVIEQDLAWRLFTRGLSPQQARQRASLTGDESLASKILDVVSIIA